jgi:hypothetical protein
MTAQVKNSQVSILTAMEMFFFTETCSIGSVKKPTPIIIIRPLLP